MNTLEELVKIVCGMNDPEFVNALEHIAQVCQQKADVLRNIQAIQTQYFAAQKDIEKCNAKLKSLIEE